LPAHQKESFESWSNHQWFVAWFCYCPMREQFQILSLNRETPTYSQLLNSTATTKGSGVVEVMVVQLYYCPFYAFFSG